MSLFLPVAPKFSASRQVTLTLSFFLFFSIKTLPEEHLFCLWHFLTHSFFIPMFISPDEQSFLFNQSFFHSDLSLFIAFFTLLSIIPTPPPPHSSLPLSISLVTSWSSFSLISHVQEVTALYFVSFKLSYIHLFSSFPLQPPSSITHHPRTQ